MEPSAFLCWPGVLPANLGVTWHPKYSCEHPALKIEGTAQLMSVCWTWVTLGTTRGTY